MKITWLGQAGLLFEKDGFRIMIDPYLSDCVKAVNPKSYRRVAVDESFFNITPDVMIFTHDHLDHYDPETAPRFITNESRITVLSPESVYRKIIRPCDTNNCVLFDRMTEWSENGIRFKSVRAVHSDRDAIGVLIFDGDMTYYITGDTLYSEEIFEDIPSDIDVLFLPVNGVGNNMNMTDASRFAKRVNAKKTVPFHIGMFDSLSADDFECENKVIPEIYKEIKL